MTNTSIDAPAAPHASGYAQAMKVDGARSLLFVSGQIGTNADGEVPADIESQCRLAWANVKAQLSEAGMATADIVKVNTFLSDRRFAETSGRVRTEMLAGHRPANSSMVATILDENWLLEIEVVAAR